MARSGRLERARRGVVARDCRAKHRAAIRLLRGALGRLDAQGFVQSSCERSLRETDVAPLEGNAGFLDGRAMRAAGRPAEQLSHGPRVAARSEEHTSELQ